MNQRSANTTGGRLSGGGGDCEKSALTCETKGPRQSTDDEITTGTNGMRIVSDVPAGAKPTCSFVKPGGFSAGRRFSCCQGRSGLLTMTTATPPSAGHGSAVPSSSSGLGSAAFQKMVGNFVAPFLTREMLVFSPAEVFLSKIEAHLTAAVTEQP